VLLHIIFGQATPLTPKGRGGGVRQLGGG